jgi:alpha-amylase/alpha-mannosidase (GH57 family)
MDRPIKSTRNIYVVVHGHFYQPPRENPWIEEIELEESAYPFPNWNARIARECYTPNTCARIRDDQLRLIDIVNNFSHINFNMGPTLLSWLAANAPVTYQRVLAADRESLTRLGFGNAIAQAYNHIILPLADARDRETEILWGLRDFASRFRRPAEAMWLPETAVNTEVLRSLAGHGMKYVILSPYQARRLRPLKGGAWQDVSSGNIDTTQPYRCFVGPERGKSPRRFIDIFFYNGQAAAEISFGDLLSDSWRLLDFMRNALNPDLSRAQVLNVATDGETFGHHKPFGEMGLAYALSHLCPERGWQVTNFRAFLEMQPPVQEVEISLGPQGEGTAWSCAHGVGRWQRDCGCNTGGEPGWNQQWRTPLRRAFDVLNEKLALIFTQAGGRFLRDPWAARDDYIEVILDRSEASREAFFSRHGAPGLPPADQIEALKLLEMERHVLLMYTSCGWFFSDLAGLETLQVLKYAARALQLGQEFTAEDLETPFLDILQEAHSNRREMGSGRDLYLTKIRPAVITFPKLVNHFSISLLNNRQRQKTFAIYNYHPELLNYEEKSQGGLDLSLGRVTLTSGITRETRTLGYATLFLGSHLYRTQVKEGQTQEGFEDMVEILFKALEEAPEDIANALATYFGPSYYSVRDMFKREKRDILKSTLQKVQDDTDLELLHAFSEAEPLLFTMTEEGFAIPPVFRLAATTTLSRKIMQILYAWAADGEEHQAKRDLDDIINISQRLTIFLKDDPAGRLLASILEQRLVALAQDITLSRALGVGHLLSLSAKLPLEVDFMEAQNLFFHLMAEHFAKLAAASQRGQAEAKVLAEVLLQIAVNLKFNPDRYTKQLLGQ